MGFKLLDVVLSGTGLQKFTETSITARNVFVQAKRANTHAIEFGPGTFVSGKGIELCKPTADQPLPSKDIPSSGGNCIELSEFSALGTTNEGLNVLYEEW
jgi:hypothetical protein